MTSGSMVLRIAVLTALILGFVNGLTPDQPNVCSKRIIVKTPVTREVTKQERIHVCDQDPFLCRWKTVFVKVNVTEIVDVPTTVYECCLGYKERRGVCQAQCDPECEHGACLQPNKCHCDPGFMGDYCQSSKCDTECQHGTCVQPNTCHCDTGYMGDYCQSECAVGTYGKDCTSACTCDEYQYCHHVMGCVQCPDGTYGKDCTSVCKCDESQYCHHAMGCVPKTPVVVTEMAVTKPPTTATLMTTEASTLELTTSQIFLILTKMATKEPTKEPIRTIIPTNASMEVVYLAHKDISSSSSHLMPLVISLIVALIALVIVLLVCHRKRISRNFKEIMGSGEYKGLAVTYSSGTAAVATNRLYHEAPVSRRGCCQQEVAENLCNQTSAASIAPKSYGNLYIEPNRVQGNYMAIPQENGNNDEGYLSPTVSSTESVDHIYEELPEDKEYYEKCANRKYVNVSECRENV